MCRLVNVLQTKLQCTIGGGRFVPVLYGLAYSLLHTWNTDRDIGFSQRQTLIADIGPPSLTHMASTIFLHGANDQQVGAGDRSFAVRVDTLMDSIQLIRTDLRPIDGILRIQVDRCPIPLLVPVPTAVWGVSFVKGCATVAAVDSVRGIDTRGCLSHSWADHHHGPRDGEDTDPFSRIAQYAGTCRVSVSARTHPR